MGLDSCVWFVATSGKCHCGGLADFVLTSQYRRFTSYNAADLSTAVMAAKEYRCRDHAPAYLGSLGA